MAFSVELILKGDEQAPVLLGQLLVGFNRALENGKYGREEMRKALQTALEAAYLSSDVHRSAVELYRLSLEGKLRFADEPAALIDAVIERNAGRDWPQINADRSTTETRRTQRGHREVA